MSATSSVSRTCGSKTGCSPNEGHNASPRKGVDMYGPAADVKKKSPVKCDYGGPTMQGLMMDYPLTLTQFFERSRRLFAQKTLATRVPGCPLFRYTYADFAERVARLAGGLTALGVCPGERVSTFAWNTHHHLEAYW